MASAMPTAALFCASSSVAMSSWALRAASASAPSSCAGRLVKAASSVCSASKAAISVSVRAVSLATVAGSTALFRFAEVWSTVPSSLARLSSFCFSSAWFSSARFSSARFSSALASSALSARASSARSRALSSNLSSFGLFPFASSSRWRAKSFSSAPVFKAAAANENVLVELMMFDFAVSEKFSSIVSTPDFNTGRVSWLSISKG